MTTKTTIYLPEELKQAVARMARVEQVSEAEIIRRAIATEVARPSPRPGIVEGEPIADRVDELLAGFGER